VAGEQTKMQAQQFPREPARVREMLALPPVAPQWSWQTVAPPRPVLPPVRWTLRLGPFAQAHPHAQGWCLPQE